MICLKSLKGRDFLSIADFTTEEIEHILKTAAIMKSRYYSGERVVPVLRGKTLLLIFQKPSTRTRISFEVAMKQLGCNIVDLEGNAVRSRRNYS